MTDVRAFGKNGLTDSFDELMKWENKHIFIWYGVVNICGQFVLDVSVGIAKYKIA